MEVWKSIPGHGLAYMVSDQGRVFSFVRGWRFLTPSRMNRGHLGVSLGGRTRCVHELVLLAFKGLRPPGAVSRHLNGIPDDNRPDNLEWNTRGINEQDKKHHNGSRGRLLIEQVIAIKQARALGATRRALSNEYGITYQAVRAIDLEHIHSEVPTWPNL